MLFGPPGGDQAAHLYLTQAWRDNGWQLWDNFWYSGRYAQVNYSLLFYPLAALLHPVTVVAASCAGAAAAFAALLRRRWPAIATVPALAFAVLVPLARGGRHLPLPARARRSPWAPSWPSTPARAASPSAASCADRPRPPARARLPAGGARRDRPLRRRGWWRSRATWRWPPAPPRSAARRDCCCGASPPTGPRYPFDPKDALAIAGFCVAGLLLTRGLPDQRPLRAVFLGYGMLGGRWPSPSRRPSAATRCA